MKIITNVGGFLDYLTVHTHLNDDYFYRGESKNFGVTKLTSSLYRHGPKTYYISQDDNPNINDIKYNTTFKYNTWKTYLNAAMSFYRDIPTLTNDEKQNFMAFCQHHGLSTPLLDISASPLVALYFACQSNFSDSGRVYIFKRDNFIPFDNEILSYNYLLNCYENDEQVYPLLSLMNKNEINKALLSIHNFRINGNSRQIGYLYRLINSIIQEIQELPNIAIDKKYSSKVKKSLKECSDYWQLYKSICNVKNGFISLTPSFLARKYIHFLRFLGICKHIDHQEKMCFYTNKNGNIISLTKLRDESIILLFLIHIGKEFCGTNPYIPKDLNFYTHCTLNWGRVKAQKSYFIIQTPYIIDGRNFGHSFTENDSPDESVLINSLSIINKPRPYLVLGIKNKREILKQLSILGINKMALFMDKDSIADFIKNRFYI